MDSKTRRGQAAVHFVLYDILSHDLNAFLAGESMFYDIILEQESGLLRIQVKSCLEPKNKATYINPSYHFNISKKVGEYSRVKYDIDDFDMLALVGFREHKVTPYIAYMPNKDCFSITLRDPEIEYSSRGGHGSSKITEYPLENALAHFNPLKLVV